MDVLRGVIMDAAISNDLNMGHRGFGNPGVRRELAKLFEECYPTNFYLTQAFWHHRNQPHFLKFPNAVTQLLEKALQL